MSLFHTGKKSNQDRNKNQSKFLDPKRDTLDRVREFIFDAYAIPEGDRERFSKKMPLRHKGQILDKNTLADLGEDDVIELVPDLSVNVNSGGRIFTVEYLPFDTVGKNCCLSKSQVQRYVLPCILMLLLTSANLLCSFGFLLNSFYKSNLSR